MQLKIVLAYAVLLTSSALDCVAGGGSVAVWHRACGHIPSGTMGTFFRRCSPGSLTCSRNRQSQHRRLSTVRHGSDHNSTGESRTLQIIPQDFALVNDEVDGRHDAGTLNLSQREHLALQDVRALDSAEEQRFYSVPTPRSTFEKHASSATGNIVRSDITEERINDFDAFRQPAAATSPARELSRNAIQNVLNAQAWMVPPRGASCLHFGKAFAILTRAVKPDVKTVLRRKGEPEIELHNFFSGSMDTFGKFGTHCGSTGGKVEFSPRRLFNATCLAADVLRGANCVTQGSGCPSGSFLYGLYVKNHSGPKRSAIKQRAVARLGKKESVLCTQNAFQDLTVQYSCSEENGGERGRTGGTEQGSLQQQISSRPGFEKLPLPGLTSQLDAPIHCHTEVAPADAYSLIEMWSGSRQQPIQSKYSPHALRSAADVHSSMQILEHNNLLNHDSLVTITYHFPFQTAESQSIAFILVALPPGYVARDNNLCTTNDFTMPALSCRLRHVDLPEREGDYESKSKKRTLFVQVSSADPSRELPLGTHRFSVGVRNPAHRLAVGLPKNWWFVTFRFSAGHTVTKHFENGLLHEKRKCAWTSWRQETPCSASCGPGFEMWTRSLLAGDDGDCGPEIVKRKCEIVPCSVNCQLGPWKTVIDCTRPCLAQKGKAFQLSVRQVLLDKQGSGISCEHLYPWDSHSKQGWSAKLHLVVRRSPCPDIFAQKCPAELGCRVERKSNRTITVAYPWGACPFPCGGIGRITSIIQVANGIPRWIGEREFPSSFQTPCRADKEPVVQRQRCNTFACEDCSIYMEAPTQRKPVRAWFFFLPSQAADIVSVTIPPRSSFALDDGPDSKNLVGGGRKELQQISQNMQTSPGSGKSWEGAEAAQSSVPTAPVPEQTVEDIIPENANERELGTATTGAAEKTGAESHLPDSAHLCRQLRASFGQLSHCYVRASARYQMSQELVIQLRQHIAPHFGRRVNRPSQQEAESEAQPPRRPEWILVPLRLSDGVNIENASNFHLWLMSSHMPRDPEVFTCHVKTPLRAPVNCKYTYSPVHPEDCDKCSQQSSNKVLMFRRFLPPMYGGTCNVPQERWQADVVLVMTACFKGCPRGWKQALRKDSLMSSSLSAAGTLEGDMSVSSEASL